MVINIVFSGFIKFCEYIEKFFTTIKQGDRNNYENIETWLKTSKLIIYYLSEGKPIQCEDFNIYENHIINNDFTGFSNVVLKIKYKRLYKYNKKLYNMIDKHSMITANNLLKVRPYYIEGKSSGMLGAEVQKIEKRFENQMKKTKKAINSLERFYINNAN
ncbi:hypothetical protein [Staphylococcus aureus]|uniref:hypothetical protein n=1 Tax=Staphylococcus aureus TaxID=1280 RepID=UPI0021134E03|nr:hypothetical protein [Staphylococcus aureus]MCQ6827910.1 hypothetical protein [Staphylococcus aureus]